MTHVERAKSRLSKGSRPWCFAAGGDMLRDASRRGLTEEGLHKRKTLKCPGQKRVKDYGCVWDHESSKRKEGCRTLTCAAALFFITYRAPLKTPFL